MPTPQNNVFAQAAMSALNNRQTSSGSPVIGKGIMGLVDEELKKLAKASAPATQATTQAQSTPTAPTVQAQAASNEVWNGPKSVSELVNEGLEQKKTQDDRAVQGLIGGWKGRLVAGSRLAQEGNNVGVPSKSSPAPQKSTDKESGSLLQNYLDEYRKTTEQEKTDAAKMAKFAALGNVLQALAQPLGWTAGGGKGMNSATPGYKPYDSREYISAFNRAVKASDDLRNLPLKESEMKLKTALAEKEAASKNRYYDWQLDNAKARAENDSIKAKQKLYQSLVSGYLKYANEKGRSMNSGMSFADYARMVLNNPMFEGFSFSEDEITEMQKAVDLANNINRQNFEQKEDAKAEADKRKVSGRITVSNNDAKNRSNISSQNHDQKMDEINARSAGKKDKSGGKDSSSSSGKKSGVPNAPKKGKEEKKERKTVEL